MDYVLSNLGPIGPRLQTGRNIHIVNVILGKANIPFCTGNAGVVQGDHNKLYGRSAFVGMITKVFLICNALHMRKSWLNIDSIGFKLS
jgi:hypothetical protein